MGPRPFHNSRKKQKSGALLAPSSSLAFPTSSLAKHFLRRALAAAAERAACWSARRPGVRGPAPGARGTAPDGAARWPQSGRGRRARATAQELGQEAVLPANELVVEDMHPPHHDLTRCVGRRGRRGLGLVAVAPRGEADSSHATAAASSSTKKPGRLMLLGWSHIHLDRLDPCPFCPP